MSCGERPDQLVNTICWFSPISGIASTATGLFGRKPLSKLKGAFTVPHPTKRTSIKTAISLFSIKNLMLLFSIDLSYKTIRYGCLKNTEYSKISILQKAIGY